MKMMFAVGRVTRDATKVLVTRQPAGTRPSTPVPADPAFQAAARAPRGGFAAGTAAPSSGDSAERPAPGDFRAACASPDTVH